MSCKLRRWVLFNSFIFSVKKKYDNGKDKLSWDRFKINRKIIVVTAVHCSWFLRLHSNGKQYPLLHPLKGLLWLRNENVLSYNFMMWMKCCNISNVANLNFICFECAASWTTLFSIHYSNSRQKITGNVYVSWFFIP